MSRIRGPKDLHSPPPPKEIYMVAPLTWDIDSTKYWKVKKANTIQEEETKVFFEKLGKYMLDYDQSKLESKVYSENSFVSSSKIHASQINKKPCLCTQIIFFIWVCASTLFIDVQLCHCSLFYTSSMKSESIFTSKFFTWMTYTTVFS